MGRVFFAGALETAASWWRVHRRDGVTLGFTTHDRDLWFDGILHRAAPGMLPSAIRATAGFEDDPGDVEGALSHADIDAGELAAGLFDGARVESGIVDWETLEAASLYAGTIAAVTAEAGSFKAQLASAKAALARDPVPLSAPACRARFCGPGCGLNAETYRRRATVVAVDFDANAIAVDLAEAAAWRHGELRWLGGPQAGLVMRVIDVAGDALVLDRRLDPGLAPGLPVRLHEGCDRTIATCAARFGNAVNFRGEPFLPGNDMLAHYPAPR